MFALLMASALPAQAGVRASFAYTLAEGSGPMALSWPSLTWEPRSGELYVVDHSGGVIGVFNDSGMQVFSFGDDVAVGTPSGVVATENGELFVLASIGSKWSVVRCNFRGEPVEKLLLKDVPTGFAELFTPSAIATAGGKLYLADKGAMKVLVIGLDGAFVSSQDLADLVKVDARKRIGLDIRGFAVDTTGNLLFTIPSLFTAYVVSPDGRVRSFGTKGGAPGKFNVVSGIAADENGNLFLTDLLRAVVMVFDKEFHFIGEFGYRGAEPENLIAPADLVVGNRRVFVTQSVGGVKAFDILIN